MRKGGGKSKGATWERQVCRELSLWISGGKQEGIFWRSAMSGGRATIAARKGKRLDAQVGDISCIHPLGMAFADRFMAECKFYRDLRLDRLIHSGGALADFWIVARAQARPCNKLPILIAKQNHTPPFVCLTVLGAEALSLKDHVILIVPKLNLRIVDWSTFLKFAKL